SAGGSRSSQPAPSGPCRTDTGPPDARWRTPAPAACPPSSLPADSAAGRARGASSGRVPTRRSERVPPSRASAPVGEETEGHGERTGRVMRGVEDDSRGRLGRPSTARQQAVEGHVEGDERGEGCDGKPRPPPEYGDRSQDGNGGARTVPPPEVQRTRGAPVPEHEADPGDAAPREVGPDHLREAPVLQVRALDRGVEDDPGPTRGEAHPEVDVLEPALLR